MNIEKLRWRNLCSSNRGSLRLLLIVTVTILIVPTATAQLKRYPVQRKNPIQKNTTLKNSTARIQAVSPLSLPFWDDFSFTPINNPADTFSGYPLRSLWEKGENVWINNGLGINIPTLNVASFDGLDSLGLPFSDQILLNGFRDDLISHPIKMTDVPVAGRDFVFFSFFFQWQGNGEPPDASDYLRVEFKDNAGNWVEVMTINTDTSFDPTVFYYRVIQVNDPKYFHDGFQFRFRNFGRKSGPFDTWNIDYVYLDGGRTNNNSYPDRAIASTISPLFGDYYAMPIQHFFETMPLERVNFEIQNLTGPSPTIAVTASYLASAKFKNYSNGVASITSAALGVETFVNGGSGLMFPYQRETVELPEAPNPSNFSPSADSIEVFIKAQFESGDDVDVERSDFLPLDFRINDTLTVKYTLNDYYAYDDGTAEYSAGLTRWGIIVAYAFDVATTEADTLGAFDAYFPDYALGTNRLINFYIYPDDNGLPDAENPLIVIRNRSAERKGLNTFQRISFSPVRVSNRFYIAYESADVQVGLDISHDTGDKIYTNIGGPWSQNTDIVGSLMIRPVFIEGVGGPITGLPEEKSIVTLYPNPNHGEFYVDRKVKVLHILSVTGQSLPFVTQEDGDQQKISIPNVSSGLYVLKIQQGTSVVTKKIVVR